MLEQPEDGGHVQVFLIHTGKAAISVKFMACVMHLHVPTSEQGMEFTQGTRSDFCPQKLEVSGDICILHAPFWFTP